LTAAPAPGMRGACVSVMKTAVRGELRIRCYCSEAFFLGKIPIGVGGCMRPIRLSAHDSDCIICRTVVFAYTSTESKVQHNQFRRRLESLRYNSVFMAAARRAGAEGQRCGSRLRPAPLLWL
jgi:hypothetical protein